MATRKEERREEEAGTAYMGTLDSDKSRGGFRSTDFGYNSTVPVQHLTNVWRYVVFMLVLK